GNRRTTRQLCNSPGHTDQPKPVICRYCVKCFIRHNPSLPEVLCLCHGHRHFESREVDGAERRGVLPFAGLRISEPATVDRHAPEESWALVCLDTVEPDGETDAILEGSELLLGAARRLRQLLGLGHGSPPFKKRNGCFQTSPAHCGQGRDSTTNPGQMQAPMRMPLIDRVRMRACRTMLLSWIHRTARN